MKVVRQSRRVRAFVALAVVGAVFLAACGGGDDDDSASKSSTTTPANGDTTTTKADSGGNGDCYTTPGKQTARVRFVNLFTNDTYPKGDIDVYQGFSGTDPCGKKLATVKFGEASDYVDVTASDESGNWQTTAFVAGSPDDEHQIMNQSETWKGGEQVTIVFAGGDPTNTGTGLPASSGSDQAFFETPDSNGNPPSIESVDGKAVIGVAATSVQYAVPDGAWVVGASGADGCLLAEGDSAGSGVSTNVGGTSLVKYDLDPGSIDISLFKSDPGACGGTADIGPTTIDAKDGSRTYVFVYGTGPTDLQLMVLPIED